MRQRQCDTTLREMLRYDMIGAGWAAGPLRWTVYDCLMHVWMYGAVLALLLCVVRALRASPRQ